MLLPLWAVVIALAFVFVAGLLLGMVLGSALGTRKLADLEQRLRYLGDEEWLRRLNG